MSEQERSYTIVVFSDQRDGDLNNIVGSTTLEGFGEKFRRGNLYWEDHIVALSEMVMELIFSYEDKVRKHKQPRLYGEIKPEHVLLIKDYSWETYRAYIDHVDGFFKVAIYCFDDDVTKLSVEFEPSATGAEAKSITVNLHDDFDNFKTMVAMWCEEVRNENSNLQ